ncbi:MAG: Dephospho-CoA kinase [Planctomycetota bacterium]
MPGAPANPPESPTLFRPQRPIVLGIAGGIAAGKSAVAAAFSAHGLVHIDADKIAREVTARTDVVAAIAKDLGSEVIAADGTLDRQAVAARVFSDASARARLEALTHPPVRQAILDAIAAAKARGDSVLLDVPLLLERGLVDQCDRVVFVHASEATRRARAASRGWADGELDRRERAQASLDEKRARADFTVDNDGSIAAMRQQVAELLLGLAAGS